MISDNPFQDSCLLSLSTKLLFSNSHPQDSLSRDEIAIMVARLTLKPFQNRLSRRETSYGSYSQLP